MNVVGKFGSLITQGVYSVATPFHPFGGAVDVIVVQQQDGSFRSTPWYVRFGKFQGVLKGAEKVVRINVNGIEANFNMYLDNSGEAYFIREVESGKESHTNGILKDSQGDDVIHEEGSSDDRDKNDENISEVFSRLEHCVSDSRVDHLHEERGALTAIKLHRAESDGDQRYYEFPDEQSSYGRSVELSEFESNSYENLDAGHGAEQQGPDSEVVLVSVDGHVLTAPVSASEQNTDVQSTTPQFHLGPGEETEEFNSGDETWASDYISKLHVSTSSVESSSVYEHQIMVCEGDGEHACQRQESQNSFGPECDIQIQSESEDPSIGIKKEDVFKSCLELSDLAESAVKVDIHVDASAQGAEDSKCCPIPVIESNESTVESTNESLSPLHISDPSGNESPLNFANGSLSLPHVSDQSENEGHLNFANESFSPPVTSYANENGSLEYANGSVTLPCVSDSTEYEESPAPETKVIENKEQGAYSRSIEYYSGSNKGAKLENVEFCASVSSGDLNSSSQVPEASLSKSEIVEPETTALTNDMQSDSNFSFEVSLCGKELHSGMGWDEAAKVFEAHRVSAEEFRFSSKSIIKNENLVIRYKKRYFSWEKVAPNVLGMAAFGLDLDVDSKDAISVEQTDSPWLRDGDAVVTPTSSGSRRWRLWPIPFRRVKTMDHSNSNASSEDIFLDTESGIQSSNAKPNSVSHGTSESPRKQLVRTNVPTSEQIASLNLKDGQNTIIFSFSTRVLGTQQVEAHLYLWKWNARIVISDVDGTITKSDVLGQFMPLVGKDWSQSGVAKLFSAIKENGYQLLFLSARAIVQAYLTKNFLFNLKQDGKTLPNGPVVISPDGLFPSLYREVIRRAPHEFKIACLEDIRRLFPADYNPFYAGFGNRDTDELSYRKIGIPKGKIFIINPKGEVAVNRHCIDVKSYTSLHTLVNDMFPPTSLVEQEDYNSWNYWRVPLPDIE